MTQAIVNPDITDHFKLKQYMEEKLFHVLQEQNYAIGWTIADIKFLKKDTSFKFGDGCLKAYEELKKKLIIEAIIIASDWEEPFELMCDASDTTIRVILGQRKNKAFHSIYYASKTLNLAEINYAVTEKYLLAVVWVFDKFRAYLVGTKVIVYMDHTTIMNLVWKSDIESRPKIRWPITCRAWKLARMLMKKLVHRCVPREELEVILHDCHASAYRRHHGGDKTTTNELQSGFYWPTLFKDAYDFVKRYDRFQRTGIISRRHEMPLKGILEVEIFNVWGIDLMGLFPSCNGHKYILVVADYVSKWVEAMALPTNDARVVVNFVKNNIFTRFGTSRALISDGGTHFCDKLLGNLLAKYG
nr:uncharacterized protein LOC104108137 [Nicotiana tomentosiformis]